MGLRNKIHGRIMVTGGTGSWGHELCKQLLNFPEVESITVLSRNEHKQVEMERAFEDKRLNFVIGDVRDQDSLSRNMSDINILFHLAALKHVPVCEKNSWQAVETNIIGTHNVIRCAIKNGVKMVVDVSTDKAVEPHNVYGITKACGEKLITNAEYNYEGTTKFVCIRGGNVIGTNGSVLPLFKKQIQMHNKVTITDPGMTRFLMSTREAISLIFEAVNLAQGGETFIMRMPSIDVSKIADTMISMYGNINTKIEIIGARVGEKLHEVLVSKNEIPFTYEISERYFVIIPQIDQERYKSLLKNGKLANLNEFSSQNARVLTMEDLIKQIKEEEWAL